MYLLTKLASNAESLWLHNYYQYYQIEISTNKLETRNRMILVKFDGGSGQSKESSIHPSTSLAS